MAAAIKERHLEKRPDDYVSQRELELTPPIPISARKCTDCLFCLIFLCYLTGVLVIGIVGFQNGNPARLVYGTDYKGRVCGEGNITDKPYLVYPRPQQDVLLAGTQVALNTPWEINFFGICEATCPLTNDYVCDDEGEEAVQDAMNATLKSRDTVISECYVGFVPAPPCHNPKLKSNCWKNLFDTTPILFRCFPNYVYDIEILAAGCIEQLQTFNVLTGLNVTSCVKYQEITKRTTEVPTAQDILFDSFNTITQVFNRNVADVVKAWPVILVSGVGVSILVGFLYIISLWLFVRFVVWGSVLGVQLMSIAFTVYLYLKAGILQIGLIQSTVDQLNGGIEDFTIGVSQQTGIDLVNASPINLSAPFIPLGSGAALPSEFAASLNYQKEFTNAAYVMTAITVMLFFLILLLRRRISRAIEIFQEASHAIRSSPCLIIIPFFSVPLLLGSIAYWVASTAYIASSGSYNIAQINFTAPVSPEDGAFEIEKFGAFTYVEVFVAYNFIGFLWISHFITAVVVFIIAGTVGHWYWKGNESEEGGYGGHPLLRSVYIVFRFHLGSAAFGSLMVAIIQFIRYLAAYLDARSKSVTQKSRIMRAVMCCVHCCLKCLEYCIKFVSRNAFIIGALYGESFCASTRQAFYTITSNLAQVALVTFLGDLILRFGQILISLMAAFSCWVYLDNRPEYDFGGDLELNTFWFPTLLSGALGWFIANECLSIYDITVDTLLISFCQDQKLKKHLKEGKHTTLKQSNSMANFIKTQKKKEVQEIDQEAQMRKREVASSMDQGI